MSFRLQLRSGRAGTLCAGLTLLLLSGGCVDNDISLSITRFIPPAAAGVMSGACVIDPATPLNSTRGVFDLDLGRYVSVGYTLLFVVSNNLATRSTIPVETQAYYINGYDVELEPEGAIAAAIPVGRRSFTYRSGSIRLTPGSEAAGFVEAIPADLIPSIAGIASDPVGLVSARVRAVGTRAEEEIHSAFSSFPIQFCHGCLGNSVNGSFPACPLNIMTPAKGNPCNLAQDSAVVCCTADAGNSIVCGDAVKPVTP